MAHSQPNGAAGQVSARCDHSKVVNRPAGLAPLSVLLFADSVLRFGLPRAQDFTSRRSNSELVHSLAALLDSCIDEAVFDPHAQRVCIPSPDSLDRAALEDAREELEVTCKLFLLDADDRDEGTSYERSAKAALDQVKTATGLDTIDLLILSLPYLRFDDDQERQGSTGECSDCDDSNARADTAPSDDEVARVFEPVWKALSASKQVDRLGVSEFSAKRLKRLIADTKASHGKLRSPAVDQVNLRDSAQGVNAIPKALIDLAERENIELLTHADCSDLLPPATFRRLLKDVADRLPPQMLKAASSLSPRWVLKYTVVHKTRLEVVDKGYIAYASA